MCTVVDNSRMYANIVLNGMTIREVSRVQSSEGPSVLPFTSTTSLFKYYLGRLHFPNLIDCFPYKVSSRGVSLYIVKVKQVGPSGHVGLRPLACRDCEFESHRSHGCLSLVSVVSFQVEVSATS